MANFQIRKQDGIHKCQLCSDYIGFDDIFLLIENGNRKTRVCTNCIHKIVSSIIKLKILDDNSQVAKRTNKITLVTKQEILQEE